MRNRHIVVPRRRLGAVWIPGLVFIAVAAVPPPVKPKPAPGLGNGLTAGWHAFRVTLSWLLAIIGAALPFAAVLALLAVFGYWARRWLRARARIGGGSRPASGG